MKRELAGYMLACCGRTERLVWKMSWLLRVSLFQTTWQDHQKLALVGTSTTVFASASLALCSGNGQVGLVSVAGMAVCMTSTNRLIIPAIRQLVELQSCRHMHAIAT